MLLRLLIKSKQINIAFYDIIQGWNWLLETFQHHIFNIILFITFQTILIIIIELLWTWQM